METKKVDKIGRQKNKVRWFPVFIIFICLALIFSLFKAWHYVALNQFEEGYEDESIVTIALDWETYDDFDNSIKEFDDCRSFNSVFCELYLAGYIEAFDGDLVKVHFDKKISIKNNDGTIRTFYMVGRYYITAPM